MTPTGQLALDLAHRPALGRDDFLVAPSNAAAVEWLDRWPRWGAPALVLHGPAGCGKTHLAQVWRARSSAIEAPAQTLASADLPTLAHHRAVIVDDAEQAPEEALLHLFNLVVESGGSLLLTASLTPVVWPIRLADLASRVRSCPAVAVEPPDDALLAAVLVKLFSDRRLPVREDVIVFLLRRIERSCAAAQRVVAMLDRAALAQRRRVTLRFARQVVSHPEERRE
jgi:chromosomal replication initiation ATPase DnaA